jgi:betaine-aldehyde dehydrogenase
MNALTRIAVDTSKLNAAMATFPRDRTMIIGGREAKGSGEMIERASPAHGVVVTRVPRGNALDVRSAIAAARAAFDKGAWPRETASTRARVLLKTAELIDRDRELLALLDTLESGKPITQARGEIEGSADIWRYAASLARELSGESYANLGSDRLGFVLRDPIGVISIITPWNFPLLAEAAIRASRRLHMRRETERDDLGLDVASCWLTRRSGPSRGCLQCRYWIWAGGRSAHDDGS